MWKKKRGEEDEIIITQSYRIEYHCKLKVNGPQCNWILSSMTGCCLYFTVTQWNEYQSFLSIVAGVSATIVALNLAPHRLQLMALTLLYHQNTLCPFLIAPPQKKNLAHYLVSWRVGPGLMTKAPFGPLVVDTWKMTMREKNNSCFCSALWKLRTSELKTDGIT